MTGYICLSKDGNIIVKCPYEDKHVPSSLGGRWQRKSKTWKLAFTVSVVEQLLKQLPDISVHKDVAERLSGQLEKEQELDRISQLARENKHVQLRVDGVKLALYNYQKLGVMFAIKNATGVLIADEMGLGKCVFSNTKVHTVNGASRIDDVFHQYAGEETTKGWFDCERPFSVLSMVDGKRLFQPVKRFYKEIVDVKHTLTLEDGRKIECAKEHGFWTNRGWVYAGDVGVGEYVVSASKIEVPNPTILSESLLELLAWQIAEGHEGKKTWSVIITQNDEVVLRRLKKTLDSLECRKTFGNTRVLL